MDDKTYVSGKQVIKEILLRWLLWGILFVVIYTILYNVAVYILGFFKIEIQTLLIIKAVITIILQGFLVRIVWKFSAKSTFSNKSMTPDNIPYVMNKIMIFTAIICALNGFYNFYQVNTIINEDINADSQVQFTELMISKIYNAEKKEEYNNKRIESIATIKNQRYIYLTILEIGLATVYLAALPAAENEILKYSK